MKNGRIAGIAGLALVLMGCVTFYLSAATSAGGYVAMGTNDVSLATFTLTGEPAEGEVVKRLIVAVKNNGTQGMNNFRLRVPGTPTIYGYGTVTGPAVEWNYPSDDDGYPLTIPKNGLINVEVVADINTWSNIQPTGLHTATSNIATAIQLLHITLQGESSGEISYGKNAADEVVGNQFELLRTTMWAKTNTTIPLSGRLLTQTVIGVWDFHAGKSDYGYQENLKVTHHHTGLAPVAGATSIALEVVDVLTGQVVGKANLPIATDSSVTITLDQGPAASGGSWGGNGLSVVPGTHRILIVQANLLAGFTKAGATATYGLQLDDFGWDDGTRQGLALSKDPNYALPIPAPVITL